MAGNQTNLFTMHSRSWRENRYVYPVVSRRSKGVSIGVNLNPDKACNFDCVYCCVDRTVPAKTREVDLEVLKGELDRMLGLCLGGGLFREAPFDGTPEGLRRVNDVAFSGDGEPTSYPRFGDACRIAGELVEKHGRAKDVKLVVITNATLLHRPKVVEALEYLDEHNGEVWGKLDAGTAEYYQLVERSKVGFGRVLRNLLETGRRREIVIQSLFMKIKGEGPGDGEVEAYVQRLRELRDGGCRMRKVQVYTVARGPAEAWVTPLENGRVDEIVEKVRELGVEVEGFYGPG